MDPTSVAEAVAGGALLFALPGFTVARATFPEWQFTGPDGARHALETATLAFVLSVGLTIVVGSILLGAAPGGFAAGWSDPLLEACLAAVTVIAFGIGAVRGAYRREPPTARRPIEPGSEGAWELGRQLDRLERERRALIAGGAASGAETASVRLREVEARIEALEQQREAEYAR